MDKGQRDFYGQKGKTEMGAGTAETEKEKNFMFYPNWSMCQVLRI